MAIKEENLIHFIHEQKTTPKLFIRLVLLKRGKRKKKIHLTKDNWKKEKKPYCRTMTGFGSSCGACKFLRRKCSSECIFAPYFCYDEAASHFAAVHKVFGASNVSKLLLHLPLHTRSDAATTISYEALARMRDPIYGCVSHIFALQQQVTS